MTIHPDLVMMDKPKMTVVVSDKKRDLSGELYPMSIFVVLNDEVKVLQVKVKLFSSSFPTTSSAEDPDDMYQALIMLYNENKMETLVGFYKTHGRRLARRSARPWTSSTNCPARPRPRPTPDSYPRWI